MTAYSEDYPVVLHLLIYIYIKDTIIEKKKNTKETKQEENPFHTLTTTIFKDP